MDALTAEEPEEPEEPETTLRTDILKFALELAGSKSTEGVIPSVAEAFEQAKEDAQSILDAVAAGDDAGQEYAVSVVPAGRQDRS